MPTTSDAPPTADAAPAQAEEEPRTRLCGRCRQPSECDPAAPPAAMVAWFLCPTCREVLVGHTGRGRQS